jgi:hypothetical protein
MSGSILQLRILFQETQWESVRLVAQRMESLLVELWLAICLSNGYLIEHVLEQATELPLLLDLA